MPATSLLGDLTPEQSLCIDPASFALGGVLDRQIQPIGPSADHNVTFPVLNEEAQLESSIERTIAFCKLHRLEIYDFCIADNGSTDRTSEIGQALVARRHPNLSYGTVATDRFGKGVRFGCAEVYYPEKS
jgi:hypothetical protein